MSEERTPWVALVTGGSRGIGAGIAAELAAHGAKVAIGYRGDKAAAEAVRDRIGNEASCWQVDVADPDSVAAMVSGVVDHYGRLDTVVSNAGVWRGGPVEALPVDHWQLVVDTSLSGTFHLAKSSGPHLRESGRGRLVVISSMIGTMGFRGDAAYASAKAGQVGLVRSLAKEMGPDLVTVNAVAPGFIETDMTSEVSDKSREVMLRRTSIRRAGQPEDVATAVRFLIFDGSYITGHVLAVDGGATL